MASLLARLFGLHRNHRDARFDRPSAPIILPTRDTRPIHTPPPSETPAPLKNWCHPFKDTQGPLAQLTHLANAAAGYYPIGRSGLFHGGVHFDSGTGIPQEQAVHCLADGEVVAFRVDTHSPKTRYFIDTLTVDKPFARNFVLVRHRLQPPKIQGSADTPPSLTFYSLYMHLRDWAKYHEDSTLPRPAYWPQSTALRVKQTVNDVLAGQPEPGLNVRHEDGGKVIDLLPRGAVVTVSGKWRYRMLEDRLGPAKLVKADGSLAGYIAASILQPVGGNQHRIKSSKELVRVRAEPKDPCEILMELPTGTVVTVSGEGPFRKLERVNQYVHFNSLESLQEPQAVDRIVVLEQPVPIKAGDLIGHLGDYQDSGADRSEQKLHLEVFSGDDIDEFFEDSRAWAQRLPDKDKTWLKLARGTPVAAHQDHISASLLPIWSSDNPCSDADLLVPKSLLDGLPPERKIRVPTGASGKTYNWYRLDGLLHDADDKLLNGWVREEVGLTPWLSSWSWEGYEVIFDYSLPKHAMASFFSAVNRFSDAQHERFSHLAERDQKGRMKIRLCDIIHRNCDGKMTADELQAALRLPAKAQAISQLVLRKESEWFYKEQKWDALDELLGHSGSTPHLNWVAEKQRIEQMGWWSEVAERVGLPPWGRPYHFHPLGLVGLFARKKSSLWMLGTTSERYESGGRGPGVVSTGSGDHGGVSYGVYQMSSKMGVVQDFIEKSAYVEAFSGLEAGTSEFNEKWKSTARNYPEQFREAQHNYIKKTHYDVQVNVILSGIGFPISNKIAALHDMVWSTSVQFGPQTKLIKRALQGSTLSSMSVEDIICAVQDYKVANNSRLFASSPTLQPGLLARAVDEKRKLLELEITDAEVE
ncbi:hypothetical protein [Pseudomonas azerbaijanorientalis]|uniref:VgrG-related protein n=1 Tax=Pseudomonas azerbaijanorientalis TaxID=2842350 RepID=UPI001C3C25C0|nr:hypothetical protein [Pseudomonas azerbaijanorientalis]QXH63910.1 hypothetical protein KSS91_10695 [Pseudomonas azerbaijanorientalis]